MVTAVSSPADAPCGECVALLDDRDADSSGSSSRLYTGHVATLTCGDAAQLDRAFNDMQQALRNGLHAVGLFSYELGAHMHGIAAREDDRFPSRILLFEHCAHLNAEEVDAWLDERAREPGAGNAGMRPAGIADVRANVNEHEFDEAITKIHAYIEAGDTYQINYTYRLHFDAYGSPFALYKRLRARQPVPYGALAILPDGAAVVSLSPELFVRHKQGTITARPMKGTAPANGNAQEDAQRAAALAADAKNRAENLMIVDLLRNDLGRIAKTGSVSVPKLFEVTRYASVLQMTSTVQAQLRDDATLAGIFRALYPCGSITGAPKRRTMQIIRELEPASRCLYTGAIGWFDAPVKAGVRAGDIGDFCMSVPIRTLVLQPAYNGIRSGEMGVGAGIVYDSIAADEFAECKLKARFLTGLGQEFQLFETMHATQADGCRHLDLHLARLRRSAGYFGFAYDEEKIRAGLAAAIRQLAPYGGHRLRLALDFSGTCKIQSAPLTALAEPVRVLLAAQPTEAGDIFLRHKSTVRDRYDMAWRMAEAHGAFDMLFFNDTGELTEGARSNVFVKLGGRWYTPPLSAGLLPGVMRSVLLADPSMRAAERRLTRDDLQTADDILICNAPRGALRAVIDWFATSAISSQA
jgi:para-aminobenzoate synthetase/4-amino-4-deoxychorismate lyase